MFSTLNITTLAPMARARVAVAAAVKPGLRPSVRHA